MTSRTVDGAARITTIAGLVTALRRRIGQTWFGPGRDLITEVRDGLEDAAAAYRSTGLPADVAERRAVNDFGIEEIDLIAAECRVELGAAATRRAAIVVGGGYALILGCWGLYYALFGSVTRFTGCAAVGNGFTIIGAITVVLSLATVGFLRGRPRGSRPTGPVTVGFAVFSLGSLLATYLLVFLSDRTQLGSEAGLVAGQIVQALSAVITGLMTLTVLYSVWRTAMRGPGERSGNAAAGNS